MTTSARLNGVIAALEQDRHVFATFAAPEVTAAVQLSTTAYDGLVFETEHKPWDTGRLGDCFQYLLNRRRIFEADSLAPAVTPLVRIPPNGQERSQWHAKQVLDLGAFGIVWPHISSVADAYNAVAACRYPRRPDRERYAPAGVRGDSPNAASRYWGVTKTEYYRRADVWPLDPDGEILVALMIESVAGVENLPAILDEVPGIGLVIIGEGDLSQELGVPRQYEHPDVLAHKAAVLKTCISRGVAVGHPHVSVKNLQQVLDDGYRFLMSSPVTTYPVLDLGRQLTATEQTDKGVGT
ncbi:aldolase/citrate lyase family protein [Phytohabitans sp. ZYX-F-186]|uniref:Aldolase/citrate lyase family protein n=1 Tax=Phytohabitans maris TaxID=3071409 RepID=A0ABU0ZKH4_9ACTN|nr:aldolase/citrate lyase family protein [Phytohabitans sp. ZYX-F-186]MDQ7907557.1 aldolase/citrate lyase family protein [Phytohabitans sp. ZYX-F-186]